jgi:hypothetical protein
VERRTDLGPQQGRCEERLVRERPEACLLDARAMDDAGIDDERQ